MLNDATGFQPADVTRVICTSISRVNSSVMDQMFKIRNLHCETGEPARGALHYSRGWVVLWVEGQDGEVEAVLKRAALDPRHAHLKVIHRSRGPGTLTEPFSVVATQGAEGAGALGRRIFHITQQLEGGTVQEPAAIWKRLSAPCLLTQDGTDRPNHRIALVSAEDSGPLELLRRLGERFHSPVVYQRFARGQSRSSDVGVSYVDILADQQVRRVQLLSRRALGHGMVRLALAELDAFILQLGNDRAAAANLAASVAACVGALPVRPALYLVTPSQEITGVVRDVLREGVAHGAPPVVMQIEQRHVMDVILGNG